MSNKTKKKSVHLLREGLGRETGGTIQRGQEVSPGFRNKQPVLLLLFRKCRNLKLTGKLDYFSKIIGT